MGLTKDTLDPGDSRDARLFRIRINQVEKLAIQWKGKIRNLNEHLERMRNEWNLSA